MTDEQIIKALECCGSKKKPNYLKCDLYRTVPCHKILSDNALDLINRKDAEIIARTEEYNDMLEQRNRCEAEIERLERSAEQWEDDAKYLFNSRQTAKAEAIKEFAKRFEDEMGEDFFEHFPYVLTAIDNLVEELTREPPKKGTDI